MISLKFSRQEVINKLRQIRSRIASRLFIEEDLNFLMGFGIITLEEYQLMGSNNQQRMNENKVEQVVEKVKVKEYTLNNNQPKK